MRGQASHQLIRENFLLAPCRAVKYTSNNGIKNGNCKFWANFLSKWGENFSTLHV